MISPLGAMTHRLRLLLGRAQTLSTVLHRLHASSALIDDIFGPAVCDHEHELVPRLFRTLTLYWSSLCVHERAEVLEAGDEGVEVLSRVLALLEAVLEKNPEIAETLEKSANLSANYAQNAEAEARTLEMVTSLLRFKDAGSKISQQQLYHLLAPLGTRGHLVLLGVTAQGERIQQQYTGPLPPPGH